ncbi:OV-16 antigen [Colletotrichum tanaceti]|uniref:OV-16 antigen n=1 Tax=Colletotrichum tanaceti TaxID=1306861 RepID=A0A4U6XKX4_9PEZI|nr:OV-16 antigen [Colletotrichum tanaceti]TKW56254.1 OV-16 antigen [Colletotrichum tanaceti]
MKYVISILALLVLMASGHGELPKSMSTTEFRKAFLEAGVVPDVLGAFDPMLSFYAAYRASDGEKALIMPDSRLKIKEAKFPFEFSIENMSNAKNITRNSRFIIYMIGPDYPTRDKPTDRSVRHYLAGNFTVEQTKSEVLSSAIIMRNSTPAFSDYIAPEPKAGSGVHRYVYLLYLQPEKFNKMGFDGVGIDKMDRKNFNVSKFRSQAGLKRPVGGTFFMVNMAPSGSGSGSGNGGSSGSGGGGNNNNHGGNSTGGNGNGRSTASIATAGSILMFITLFTAMLVWM